MCQFRRIIMSEYLYSIHTCVCNRQIALNWREGSKPNERLLHTTKYLDAMQDKNHQALVDSTSITNYSMSCSAHYSITSFDDSGSKTAVLLCSFPYWIIYTHRQARRAKVSPREGEIKFQKRNASQKSVKGLSRETMKASYTPHITHRMPNQHQQQTDYLVSLRKRTRAQYVYLRVVLD